MATFVVSYFLNYLSNSVSAYRYLLLEKEITVLLHYYKSMINISPTLPCKG